MRAVRTIAVLGLYLVGGPLVGGLLVALGFSIVNGMSLELAPLAAYYGVLGGYYSGLVPALAAYLAHIMSQKLLPGTWRMKAIVSITGGVVAAAWTAWIMWVPGYEAQMAQPSRYGLFIVVGVVGALVAYVLCHLVIARREQQA
jgi:H+/Cl- antiporter ClcA